jgi:hypothetical protein
MPRTSGRPPMTRGPASMASPKATPRQARWIRRNSDLTPLSLRTGFRRLSARHSDTSARRAGPRRMAVHVDRPYIGAGRIEGLWPDRTFRVRPNIATRPGLLISMGGPDAR